MSKLKYDSNMSEIVDWFQQKYPILVQQMRNVSHHFEMGISSLNPYHLEGDVWTHTMMICLMAQDLDFPLRIAALLHDIGKPSTVNYNFDKQRVSFFSHEPVSAFLALDVLEEIELNTSEKIRIFKVINMHTEGFKKTPEQLQDLLQNDQQLYNDLRQLSYADSRGRFYHSGHGGETLPELIVNGKGCVETQKSVTFKIGLPCSGKSSDVDFYKEDLLIYKIVSRDNCLMSLAEPDQSYNEAWKSVNQDKVNKLLEKELKDSLQYANVIIDMTNMTRKGRRKLLNRYKGYSKIAHIHIPPTTEIGRRNSEREGKVLHSEVITRMMKSFYLPLYDEFDEIMWFL